MFKFKGVLKRRPKVRKDEKASLLHRTQEERRKRRRKSFIPGYRERKQQYSLQRSAFDFCAHSAESGSTFSITSAPYRTLLVRQLLFLYKQKEDAKQLICLIKHSSLFVKQLDGSERPTCLFQIKRLMSLCCRWLQSYNDDSLNVALPMRNLEVFSSENTSLPVLLDASYVVSVIEQVLHYVIHNGYYRSLYLLINSKLPSSIEYSDLSRVPIANILLENVLKPLHFTYSSCTEGARQQVFSAFTEEFLATVSPYEPFLNALLLLESRCSKRSGGEGLLVYLHVLQIFSVTCASSQDFTRDSEDKSKERRLTSLPGPRTAVSAPYITEECLKKLDTKQQTSALLNLVWRDTAIRLLYSLAFNARFLWHLWVLIFSMTTQMITRPMVPLPQVISRGCPMSLEDSGGIILLFYLFNLIEVVGQRRLSMMPFTLEELVALSRCLRDACLGIIKLAYLETKPEVQMRECVTAFQSISVTTSAEMQQCIQMEQKCWIQLFKVIANLVKMLNSSDTRRNFCPPNHWLSEQEDTKADKVTQLYVSTSRHVWRLLLMGRIGQLQSTLEVGLESPQLSVSEEWQLTVLTELPFVVPFEEDGPFLDGINVTIRRNYIYEDAYDKLSPENEPDLKNQICVHLLNAHGLDEAGLDGGGIFREFLNELLKSGFNPNQGFFKTPNEGVLYPNLAAQMLVEDSFYFLGRMLGKALYENLLVELPFAGFFLSKLLGINPEVCRNLLFLKNAEELALNFTMVNNDLGVPQVVELKLGGKDIPVTSVNHISYILLVADYRLNTQIHSHCLAFPQGLPNILSLEWLRMFDQKEIQVLISGAQVPISYSAHHPGIKIFWKVVEGFTDEEKLKLLEFVTPLLGFQELYPAFCIHNGGSDLQWLPTASTCRNLLKLPEFYEETLLRIKLLYAIQCAAGFELS
ncbi:UBE3C-containing [Ictidomys tridecemlineatus]|uniref:HECT-type E3 ubiquitin transferase n=1 Tax=Ictidomys tridecemlineatus TaxID=43179 RepID=A0A287CZW1_ICTTR|nr:UBE3C-containing [Ictidomys tridecemlineatus]